MRIFARQPETGSSPSFAFHSIDMNEIVLTEQQVALTLLAIEETIKEQNEPLSDLAYFGALVRLTFPTHSHIETHPSSL